MASFKNSTGVDVSIDISIDINITSIYIMPKSKKTSQAAMARPTPMEVDRHVRRSDRHTKTKGNHITKDHYRELRTGERRRKQSEQQQRARSGQASGG